MISFFIENTAFEKLSDDNLRIIWNKKRQPFVIGDVDLKDLLNYRSIFHDSDLVSLVDKELGDQYLFEKKRLMIFLNTYKEVGAKTENKSIFSLVPESIIDSYVQTRLEILNQSLQSLKKKSCYNELINFFKQKEFVLNRLMNYEIKTTSGTEKINLDYAANFRFKAVDGGLNYFHLPKTQREKIIPQSVDDVILYIDFRQFEFRTFLELSEFDIDFSIPNLYDLVEKKTGYTKQQILAYTYSSNDRLENIFKKKRILEKINSENLFVHEMNPILLNDNDEPNKKLHTIIQSISYYRLLKKLLNILLFLSTKKSKLLFPFHDAILVSWNQDEKDVPEKIINLCEDNIYKVKTQTGNTFLEKDMKNYE